MIMDLEGISKRLKVGIQLSDEGKCLKLRFHDGCIFVVKAVITSDDYETVVTSLEYGVYEENDGWVGPFI